jgi:type II secretory pathway component PulK
LKELKYKNTDEKGFALLLVVFIVSLATIIVTVFSTETFSFLKLSRATTDSISADYAAQSALEVALSILEIPEDPAISQPPWQILNAMPALPIPGFIGEVRVQIIDKESLINVNAIAEGGTQSNDEEGSGQERESGSTPDGGASAFNSGDFWRFALVSLFNDNGYSSFGMNGSNTPQFSVEQQIAIMSDWVDRDTQAFSSNFPAKGNESSSGAQLYLNRPLKNIDEIGRIPGISKAFLQVVSPYLRADPVTESRINVNTASPLVLKAIGFQDNEMNGILDKRQVQPLTPQELEIFTTASTSLSKVTTTSSNGFKILVRSKTVSAIRWLEVDAVVQSGFGKKVAAITSSRVL